MLILKNRPEEYLEASRYIDWKHPAILQKAEELAPAGGHEIDFIRNAYHFVRDEIAHSWDIQDKRITRKATDVLREKVGICWAKANLLAALLRSKGIPAGLCYQRLTLGDTPERGYCLHALNAVYSETLQKWIRLDARGNKPGIHAEMDVEQEKLAFSVRTELGEVDDPTIYARPLPVTMEVLERNDDALWMCLHDLPDRIEASHVFRSSF